MRDSIITPPVRERMERASLREQLECIKNLELLIAKKRINESYDRIIKEAEAEFSEPVQDGGQ